MEFVLSQTCGQVQTIVCDGRGALLSLQEQSSNRSASKRDRIRYRIRAQIMANADESVYEVTTKGGSHQVLIRLLHKGELTPGTSEEEEYMESYLLDHPTEGLPLSQGPRLPYMRRNRWVDCRSWSRSEAILD
jgi:histone deacetylase complex regulatory component SIN3